ncbi:alkyl hydroperoxide reductase/ Thiol specific antioxidant/ Mal allergen [Cellulomonas flavigena DSM 20109]|uniref:Alkyl hydroperoxide reductase/ Thiol specific antioxidant/ Mal allergen n=1 Tax=Cellulomonas flavigena (strain ATCC 482 / DSM 20109 / BCRC 11376 / JCM 18109 / NBRC 3775 / NCIMB 8073 / NRS 134) TaxID=446466 RepID=D5UE66_CELFN|nr:redoxin domain-containing protein [Cellulomonas flavigena]ADG76542.1 alkyl hydroperoxide reductase/ Thiol specific antioxidant/ Mal allergen [Cellulomonas flavigena DSM 20109]
MTSASATRRLQHDRQLALQEIRQQQAGARRRQVRSWTIWGISLLAILGVVVAALLSARPVESSTERTAPGFTLPVSDGTTVSLSDFAGSPVVLYFNEGAGCDSCLVQMQKIEQHPGFAEAGITVLPIVMNTAEQINADRLRLGVEAPFLLDDGTVSEAYGVLGTGMHEGLPGHGFVLIDPDGTQTWFGDYPSMWLDPADLLKEVTSRL